MDGRTELATELDLQGGRVTGEVDVIESLLRYEVLVEVVAGRVPEPVPTEPEEGEHASQVLDAPEDRDLLAEVRDEKHVRDLEPGLRALGLDARTEFRQAGAALGMDGALDAGEILAIASPSIARAEAVRVGQERVKYKLDVLPERRVQAHLDHSRRDVEWVHHLLRIVDRVLRVDAAHVAVVDRAAQSEAAPGDPKASAQVGAHVLELQLEAPRVAVRAVAA